MFKPHHGICICHNEKRLIVVKKGLCKQGNDEQKRNIRGRDTSKIQGSAKRGLEGTGKKILGNGNLQNNGSKDERVSPKSFHPKKKRKPILYRRKPSGELAVFQEIAEGIEAAICSCCKKGIASLQPINFSHIVPKSIAPGLRLDKRNIWICCAECHQEWEFGDRNQLKFKEKNEQAQKLKQEYYGKGKTTSK